MLEEAARWQGREFVVRRQAPPEKSLHDPNDYRMYP
jgi:hypothetical protein